MPSLSDLPGFYGGYRGASQANQQADTQTITEAHGLMGILAQAQAAQGAQQLKGVLAQTGGDVEKAMGVLIQTGNIKGAHELAPILKLQREADMSKSISGMGGLGALTADQADALAQKAAIGNHPGAIGFAKLAEQKRAQEDAKNTLGTMRDQPQGIPAGAVVAGQKTVIPVPADEVAAFAKVAQAAQQGQVSSATPEAGDPQMQSGGVFGPLMQSESPAIAARAKQLQAMTNNPNFKGDPARLQKEADNLTRMEASFQQQRSLAADRAANRPEPRDPMKSVLGEDGKPTLIPESKTEGMTPFQPSMHGGVASGREAIFQDRVRMSANQASKDLENVVALPMSASTGMLGGRKQGPGLLDAGKEVLANKMTSRDAQIYNAMATGFQRSLATIESAGLSPSGMLSHQMESVMFKEGDDNWAKLHKLAQTRQIVETGLENLLHNDRSSQTTKDHAKEIIARVEKAVPFSHLDLIKLANAQETNPKATLKEVMGAMGGDKVQEFATEADAAKAGLKPGTKVKIGGRPGTWQ